MATTRYCASCLTTFADAPERCPNLSCGAASPREGWGTLLGPGDQLDRNYHIDKVLAVGGAGLTYLAREVDADGQPHPPELAIKVLYTQRDSGPFLRRLANEAQILQDLDHENIVECRGFVHRTGRAPYLVTLFEHGGTLTHHIKRVGALSPVVAGAAVRQVLLALEIAHQRGVVHRDLKPENVLLHAPVDRDVIPQLRVTDFGIAKIQGGVGQALTRIGSFVGTPEYAAPEQFEGKAPTPATDVFATGGLLYYLLTERAPFRFNHRLDLDSCYDELLAQLPPRAPTACGDARSVAILDDILANMMRVEQTDRWTIRQILARLDDLFAGAPAPRTASAADRPYNPDDYPDDALDTGGTTFIMAPGDDLPPTASAHPSAHGTLLLTKQGVEPQADPFPRAVKREAAPPAPAFPERPADRLPGFAPAPPPPMPGFAPAPPMPEPPKAAPPAPRRAEPPPPADALSLDDLFGAPDPDPNDLSLDDLFGSSEPAPPRAAPRRAPPSAREADPFGGFFDSEPSPRPAASSFEPTPAAPEPAPAIARAGRWEPHDPEPLPHPLPGDVDGLLRALASVEALDRPLIVSALRGANASALTDALRSHRAGQDPRLGRGVGLAIAALARHDLANSARGLLNDTDPGVRCCAAQALGAVGAGGLLAQLNRLLADPVPTVRASAARALADACARTEQRALGRGWLSQVAADQDTEVRDAYRLALTQLD